MTQKIVTSRRTLLGTSAAVTGALAAPAVLRRAWAADSIKVSAYGGYFEDSMRSYVYPEFTKQTGIEIESVSQSGGFEWFVGLKSSVAAGSPVVDVSMAGQGEMRRAPELFIPLEASAVPNLDNIPEYLILRNEAGIPLSAPVLAWYGTFVTNTDVWQEAPTSWADAWDPKFSGELGWTKGIDFSYLIDIVAKTYFGGNDIMDTDDGLMTCMEKAIELKDNVRLWFRDEGQFQAMLQSGELTGGQYYHDVTEVMIQDGFPMRSTFPREGGVIDFGSWTMIEGTAKTEASQEFINWSISPEVQTMITDSMWTAPVLPRDMLPDLTDETFSHASSAIEPIVPRFQIYVEKGDWLSQRWNELLLDV